MLEPPTKLKSVGMEVKISNANEFRGTYASPKKATPRVPTHIVAPYKRSKFCSTEPEQRRIRNARTERVKPYEYKKDTTEIR